MKIYDFVEKELQFFRDECNFTDEERFLFDMRAKDKTLIEVQLALQGLTGIVYSESKINRISKSVNRKILKVL